MSNRFWWPFFILIVAAALWHGLRSVGPRQTVIHLGTTDFGNVTTVEDLSWDVVLQNPTSHDWSIDRFVPSDPTLSVDFPEAVVRAGSSMFLRATLNTRRAPTLDTRLQYSGAFVLNRGAVLAHFRAFATVTDGRPHLESPTISCVASTDGSFSVFTTLTVPGSGSSLLMPEHDNDVEVLVGEVANRESVALYDVGVSGTLAAEDLCRTYSVVFWVKGAGAQDLGQVWLRVTVERKRPFTVSPRAMLLRRRPNMPCATGQFVVTQSATQPLSVYLAPSTLGSIAWLDATTLELQASVSGMLHIESADSREQIPIYVFESD